MFVRQLLVGRRTAWLCSRFGSWLDGRLGRLLRWPITRQLTLAGSITKLLVFFGFGSRIAGHIAGCFGTFIWLAGRTGHTFSVRCFNIRLAGIRLITGRTGSRTNSRTGIRTGLGVLRVDAGHLSLQTIRVVLARVEQVDDDSWRLQDSETARQIRKDVLQVVVDVADRYAEYVGEHRVAENEREAEQDPRQVRRSEVE